MSEKINQETAVSLIKELSESRQAMQDNLTLLSEVNTMQSRLVGTIQSNLSKSDELLVRNEIAKNFTTIKRLMGAINNLISLHNGIKKINLN